MVQEPSTSPRASLLRLQSRWRQLLLLDAALIMVAFGLLRMKPAGLAQPPGWALQWLLLASAVLLVEMAILRRHLDRNRACPEGTLHPTLGWGNGVTLARGVAYAFMAGFLFAPRPGGLWNWAPAFLYLIAFLADYLDGYLARATGRITELGEVLDIEFDGLGILIAVGLAVQYGQLPAIFLLLAVARPLFVWGMAWRERKGLPNHPMTESSWRRLVAGLLMGFVAVVLWPIFTPPATYIAAGVFGIPVAVSFLRDWLVVSGRLRPASPAYRRWRRRLKAAVFGWTPLLLRLAALPAVVWVFASLFQRQTAESALLLPIAVGGMALAAALLGIATRLAGIILTGLACFHLVTHGQGAANWLLLAVAGLLVELGGGRFALWSPEEDWLQRRGGPIQDRPAPGSESS